MSYYSTQKTIGQSGQIEGVGLHTGKKSTLVFKPAAVGKGVSFYRSGLCIERLDGTIRQSSAADKSLRCSYVGDEKNKVLTVEHLLASLLGLGITNIDIEVDGPEVPGLDGSAIEFVRCLKKLKIVDQKVLADKYKVQEPIFCAEPLKSICVFPDENLSVKYTLDYNHPHLKAQIAHFELTPEIFEKEIAPARTFCTQEEAEQLQKLGFGLGANKENTVVVMNDGSHKKSLRFSDEPVRHKILDILGDLGLLGLRLAGRVVAIRSGHALNQKLVQEIKNSNQMIGVKK